MKKIIITLLIILLVPINVKALRFNNESQNFRPNEKKSIFGGVQGRQTTMYSCEITEGTLYFEVINKANGCEIIASNTKDFVTSKLKIKKTVIVPSVVESYIEKEITINKGTAQLPDRSTPSNQVTTTSGTTSRKNVNVGAFCMCEYSGGSLQCGEDCSEEKLKNMLQVECGKGELETSNIEYTCTGTQGMKVGKSLNEACDFGTDAGDGIVTISASAKCNSVIENVGEGFCEDENIIKVFTFLGYILMFAKVLVPLIIIALATFDLYKAVVANDNEALEQQIKVVIRRIITGIIIFLVPTLIKIGMSFIYNWREVEPEFEKCLSCVLEPGSCISEQD